MKSRSVGPPRYRIFEPILLPGKAGITGMCSLNGLVDLHLIAEQDEIASAASHCDRVSEADLTGLIYKQKVKRIRPEDAAKPSTVVMSAACSLLICSIVILATRDG
jgi:hypothetical protein